MHKYIRTTVFSLVSSAFLLACGGGEECDTLATGVEPDSVSAMVSRCDTNPEDPSCGNLPDPAPTLYPVALTLANDDAAPQSVGYNIVVKTPSGSLRQAYCRGGTASVPASGHIQSAVTTNAYGGDRVDVTATAHAPGGASSTYGQTVQGAMHCTARVYPYWGTMLVGVSC